VRIVFDRVVTIHLKQNLEAIAMESGTQSSNLDPQMVSVRAYEIWESLGRPEGAAERTWLEAVRQLSQAAEQAKQTETSKTTTSVATSSATVAEEPTVKAASSFVENTSTTTKNSDSEPPSSPNGTSTKDKKSSNNQRRARR
jgi:hypothetical protein